MRKILLIILLFTWSVYASDGLDDPIESVEQGNSIAQFFLGVMYEYGEVVAEDDVEALRWYRKSAVQGNSDAQCILGIKYANGEGVAEDDVEAVRWYRKSAEQGDADAQHDLGLMHANGEGVAEDNVQAYAWFSVAAAQGHEQSKIVKKRIATGMTSAEITKAQKLSREFLQAYGSAN